MTVRSKQRGVRVFVCLWLCIQVKVTLDGQGMERKLKISIYKLISAWALYTRLTEEATLERVGRVCVCIC